MSRIDTLLENGRTCSYEFFPPKNEIQAAALEATIGELALAGPDFISVTYGALGSTRETTKELAISHNNRWNFPTMAHLTCVGQQKDELSDLVDTYAAAGLENILALRGDGNEPGDFRHAVELASFIKGRHPSMAVGVAAHPEIHPDAAGRGQDRRHLAAKLEVADFAITQFFFNADDYYDLVNELDALGCQKPVIPGVMLFSSAAGLRKMADMNNTALPKTLITQLEAFDKPADISKLAVETAAQLAADLDELTVPGLHIYTLNKSQPALQLRELIACQ